MKRDDELCRLILLEIESDDGFYFGKDTIRVAGYSDKETSYNVLKLREAGLVVAECIPDSDPESEIEHWIPSQITNKGHDFLDAIRSDTLWHKTKAKLARVGGSAPFEILIELAKALAKAELGLAA